MKKRGQVACPVFKLSSTRHATAHLPTYWLPRPERTNTRQASPPSATAPAAAQVAALEAPESEIRSGGGGGGGGIGAQTLT